jgi:pimeloyl-ACP methyl ester carboxylesterase
MPEIELSHGTIEYSDQGSGPVVVFIHGLLVNGRVWERVVPGVAAHARCIVPELPLGSHPRPMRLDADLTPPGLAALIAEFLQRLELQDVTLVGNDTGGALCQLVVTQHPQRIGRLVLTNCDAFEHFPPKAFKPVIKAGSRPSALAVLDLFARLPGVAGAAMRLAPLTVDPIPGELLKAWLAPLHDRRIRRDAAKAMRDISAEHTLEAAERLPLFDRPVLIAWGTRDKFFVIGDGERLAALFPDARLERIDDARTFVQLDAPERLAELIVEHVTAADDHPTAAREAVTTAQATRAGQGVDDDG